MLGARKQGALWLSCWISSVLSSRKTCRSDDHGLTKVAGHFQIGDGGFRHRKIDYHVCLSQCRRGIVGDLYADSAAPHNFPDVTAHGRMLRSRHGTGEGKLRVGLRHGDHPLPHPSSCSCDDNPRQ